MSRQLPSASVPSHSWTNGRRPVVENSCTIQREHLGLHPRNFCLTYLSPLSRPAARPFSYLARNHQTPHPHPVPRRTCLASSNQVYHHPLGPRRPFTSPSKHGPHVELVVPRSLHVVSPLVTRLRFLFFPSTDRRHTRTAPLCITSKHDLPPRLASFPSRTAFIPESRSRTP